MTDQTAQPHTGRDPLGTVLFALAVGALALAPTQLTLQVKGPALHPAEPLLALAALVWAVRWLRARDTRSLAPRSHWLLVAAGALSVVALITSTADADPVPGALVVSKLQAWVNPSVLKGWIMETAQAVLYLLVAVTVFRAAFTTPRRITVAVFALLATTTLAVGLGVAQRALLPTHYTPDPAQRVVFKHVTPQAYLTVQTPAVVCSTFGNWNEKGFHPSRAGYVGFLALALPFALAALLTDRRLWVRVWMGLLLAGAAISVLAGFLVPAIVFGLLATGAALGPRAGRAALIGAMAYGIFLLAVGGFNRAEVLQAPATPALSPSEARYVYEDGTRHLKKFWGEQQAALNLVRYNPVFGVGSGNYQNRVGNAYGAVSRINDQRLEPDTQNGYLLAAASTGLVGLAALLALLGGAAGQAWARLRQGPRSPWAAAVFGALVALLVMFLATNPWVRGTSVLIALVLALTANGATQSPAARIDQQEGNSCG